MSVLYSQAGVLFSDIINQKLHISNDDIIAPEKTLIISKDKKGHTLSVYGDNSWDMTYYRSSPKQNKNINFQRFQREDFISEIKRMIFMYMLFGSSGRISSSVSVESIQGMLSNFFAPFVLFLTIKKLSFREAISDEKYIIQYIKEYGTSRKRLQKTLTILNMLDRLGSNRSGFNYKHSKQITFQIANLKRKYEEKKQTEIIPTRILSESLKERWGQIDVVLAHKKGILTLLEYLLFENYSHEDFIVAVEANNLDAMTTSLSLDRISSSSNFSLLLTKIFGTIKHLILAYSGMRDGEALCLTAGCYTVFENVLLIESVTTKFHGKQKLAKWVASSELKKVLDLMSEINTRIASMFSYDLSDFPLFWATSFINGDKSQSSFDKKILQPTLNFYLKGNELSITPSRIVIREEDVAELELIEYDRDWRGDEKFAVGAIWHFKPHQYRRSLVVYALQSGLVSIGSLQIQLKHFLRDMSLYYANGASRARQLFELEANGEHIAMIYNNTRQEIDALSYVRNVLLSDETLFGQHGSKIEKQKPLNPLCEVRMLELREATEARFRKGELGWKETPLGGCVSLERCDQRMTRSIVACTKCDGAVIKINKLNKVIEIQESFVNKLNPLSVEYRNEIGDLNELKKYKNKLEKADYE